MAVSFDRIPANLRVPLAWFEVDPSAAGGSAPGARPALLMGQRIAAGTVLADTLHRITSAAEAADAHGQGSMLHRMAVAYRAQDPFGELWTLGIADPGGGAAATRALVVTGPATADGTLFLYIGGQLLEVGITNGDAATAIAAEVNTEINAANDLPVTCANPAAPSVNLTLTALNVGVQGNEIDVRANFRGAAGGESWPAGVTITAGGVSIETTPVRLTGGTGNVTLTDAIAALGDTEFDFIAFPWSADASMDVLETELGDATGRWSPLRPVYGHAFTAGDDTVMNLGSAGNGRNSQHTTYLGIESCPAPVWELCAALAGQAAVSFGNDPARPLHTLPLNGILAPRATDRFTAAERNTLLTDGITTTFVDASGVVRLDPVITTYQTDASSQPDESMLDTTTMFTLAYLQRDLKTLLTSKYGRHKLANDGTQFGPGQAIVTPSMVKGEIIGRYRLWESLGLVENIDAFVDHLVVERSLTNAKRLNVYFPPDVVNPLEVVAVRTAFRRQY